MKHDPDLPALIYFDFVNNEELKHWKSLLSQKIIFCQQESFHLSIMNVFLLSFLSGRWQMAVIEGFIVEQKRIVVSGSILWQYDLNN